MISPVQHLAFSVVYLLKAGHLVSAKRKPVDLLHSQIAAAERWVVNLLLITAF